MSAFASKGQARLLGLPLVVKSCSRDDSTIEGSAARLRTEGLPLLSLMAGLDTLSLESVGMCDESLMALRTVAKFSTDKSGTFFDQNESNPSNASSEEISPLAMLLSRWEMDPFGFGAGILSSQYRTCEE